MLAGLSIVACGEDGAVPPAPTPSLQHFGYIAVACDHDDPFDAEVKTDYSDEVAGFTNANHVCPLADETAFADRLRVKSAQYRPLLAVESFFFEFDAAGGRLSPAREALWDFARRAITASGVDPDRIIFYLVDEPTLRGLPLSQVSTAAQIIKRDYPNATVAMIEAFDDGATPVIPAEIDWWGFDAYAVRDPNAEPRYTSYLNLAAGRLRAGQKLIIALDANHTPIHLAAGLAEPDMATVAENYLRLANARTDVVAMIGYAWAGGIDSLQEKGVRDLPQVVIDAHRRIGETILAQ